MRPSLLMVILASGCLAPVVDTVCRNHGDCPAGYECDEAQRCARLTVQADAGLDAGVDAGLPSVGDPCTTDASCDTARGHFCIPEANAFGQPTGYTGGACTVTCAADAICGAGRCDLAQGSIGLCQRACRVTTDCRSGFVCATAGFCRPDCRGGGSQSGCPAGTTCDAAGRCS